MSTSRTRILDSARDAFVDRGLIGASIGDVSDAADASVGSIYHHFEGKEGLAAAVYVAALADFQSAFAGAVAAEPDAEAGIRAGVRTVLRWCLRDQPDQARILLSAADAARGAAADELRALNREFFAAILAWLRPHVAAGAVRDLDLDLAHAVWLGPAHEYARLRLAGRARATRTAARALEDAAWLSLRSQGAES